MIFAYIFISLCFFVGVFQLALVFGAPLGEFTLGGKFPGKLPPTMRVAALLQIGVLVLFILIVMSKSGLALVELHEMARKGIWVVLGFFILGTIFNFSSPSKKEKMIMGPLNVIALFCAFMIARI